MLKPAGRAFPSKGERKAVQRFFLCWIDGEVDLAAEVLLR